MNILRKLTIKNLKLNKLRTIMTILGIMLSVALLTVIIGVFTGAWKTSINAMKQRSGDYTYNFYPVCDSVHGDGFTEEMRKTIENHRAVERADVFEIITSAKNPYPEKSYYPYISIMSLTPSAYEPNNCTLESGRYPEKDDELLLTSSFIRYSKKEYKVGDVIELETGRRVYLPFTRKEDGTLVREESEFQLYGLYQGDDNEKFISDGIKKYTVVGILKNEGGILNTLTSEGSNAFTYRPAVQGTEMYVKLYDDCETKYISVISDIFGIDEELVRKIRNNEIPFGINGELSAEDQKIVSEYKNALNSKGVDYYLINYETIKTKHLFYDDMSDAEKSSALVSILTIVLILAIIVLSCVIIIRNSFNISVTEKIKLYGMLASTGATPRQIRRSVFYEAVILGIIGIPLGMLTGAGVTAGIITIINNVFSSALGGITVVFDVPLYAVIGIACLGVVTIFLSALHAALSAARISPLEAVRSSNEIKIKKSGKEKSYKAPRLVKKLFGIGGVVSWKNMKRSRRQYRTTVLSIVISVAVYITASTYVDYNIASMKFEGLYDNIQYGLRLGLKGSESGKIKSRLNAVVTAKGVEDYAYSIDGGYYGFLFNKKDINEDTLSSSDFQRMIFDTDGNTEIDFRIVGVDDATFESICKNAGKSLEECRYKGFIGNNRTIDDYYGNPLRSYKILKDFDEITLKAYDEEEKYPEGYYNGDEAFFDDEGDYIGPEPEIIRTEISVDIAGTVRDDFKMPDNYYGSSETIYVTADWFERNKMESQSEDVWINSSDLNALEDHFNEIRENEEHTITTYDFTIDENYIGVFDVYNMAKYVNTIRSSILAVKLFIYGFIFVIALIGVTNIFNTITTNMNMRRKEFAMLRSVGMTNREFNRMIRLESFLYTLKSLLYGIPLGLFFSGIIMLIFRSVNQRVFDDIGIIIPWKAMLISLAAVLVLLWVIMKFSLVKIKKQNIIETIRNDNI